MVHCTELSVLSCPWEPMKALEGLVGPLATPESSIHLVYVRLLIFIYLIWTVQIYYLEQNKF